MRYDLIREIVGFRLSDESLQFFVEFSEGKIHELKPLFNTGDDYDMLLEYHIPSHLIGQVAEILNLKFRPGLKYYVSTSRKE